MRHRSIRLIGMFLAMALALVAAWPTGSADAAAYPNDPDYVRQWALRRVGAPAAWKVTKGKGVKVAVIDTGVNYRHPDLKKNLLAKLQYDSINDDGDALDLHGHGTGVAGVIAAVTNNKEGIAGIAPESKIMAVRAFGALEGANPDDVTDAINWAVANGADVINMSLGSGIPWPPEEAAVLAAVAQGVLVVASAGNGGEDGVGDPQCGFPAFNPAALCIGATDSLDRLTGFSNYALRLDMVAPGQGIWTTGGLTTIGYSGIDGTSFSAPMVAGAGALLMSMGANNVLAGLILRSTAKDLGLPGYDITYGWGRLDVKAAVELCQQIC